MKIAIFHQFIDQIGGAERVCLILARELNADIYTTNIDNEKIKKMGFSKIKIKSIGKVPKEAPLRQQIALARFRRLCLKSYDYYIIGGDWAISAAVNHKPNLWYVHSPIREIWDLSEYVKKNLMNWWKRPLFDLWVKYNRFLNKKYIEHVEKIVCNSENTKNRLERYLKRKANIIHPPIETSKFRHEKEENFWLSVNRLINHKRVEMQIKAFAKMPDEKLIIVGSYEKSKSFLRYKSFLEKIKPKNVEIKSWVSDEELIDLYSKCKGFITTSKDEDFGMTPLEAMASGKQVIAPNEGGYKETIIQNVTGRLIDNITPEKIINSVKQIKNLKKYRDCINQAKKFDTKIFINKIKKELKK